jgi:hypothetical protein
MMEIPAIDRSLELQKAKGKEAPAPLLRTRMRELRVRQATGGRRTASMPVCTSTS